MKTRFILDKEEVDIDSRYKRSNSRMCTTNIDTCCSTTSIGFRDIGQNKSNGIKLNNLYVMTCCDLITGIVNSIQCS